MRFPKVKVKSLILLIAVFLLACSSEIQMARNIKNNMEQIAILCDFPDYIILSNSTIEEPNGMNEEEEAAFYDSAYSNSIYIQYIDDTLFMRKFQEYIKQEFDNYDVRFYHKDQINEFLSTDGVLYLANFKQLELEERWEPFHAEERFDSLIYEEDFWIMGLSLNAWIDVARINDTVEVQRQLYKESVLKDDVDGMFFQNEWSGEVHYQYRIDTLKVRDIWELELQSAEDFSLLIMNTIINKEIRDRLDYYEGVEPVNEWKISPSSGRLLPEVLR